MAAKKKTTTSGASAPHAIQDLNIGRITAANHSEWVDPTTLREHPRNGVYFGEGSASRLEALGDDLAVNGFKEPIVISDGSCACGANVVIRGWRRTRAAIMKGIATVPIVRVGGLTAAQEEQALVQDNLSDLLGRRYTPSERARLARGIRENYAALGLVGVEINPSGGKRSTAEIIARVLDETTNGVKDLEAVFGSPQSTEDLQVAVDEGRLPISEAVRIVRDVGRRPDFEKAIGRVRSGKKNDADDAAIAGAKSEVNALLTATISHRESAKNGVVRQQADDAGPVKVSEPTADTSATDEVDSTAPYDALAEACEFAEAAEANITQSSPEGSATTPTAELPVEGGVPAGTDDDEDDKSPPPVTAAPVAVAPSVSSG